MKKEKPSLYTLAKFPNLEIVLDSQLASAGAHQSKVLEKCEKNQKYIKSQKTALKVISAVLMLFVPFMFLLIYIDYVNEIDLYSLPIEGIFIVFSSFLTIFLILSLLYTFLFGLFTTSSLMSGTAFKWLQTLPLSKKDLRKLGFMTLFRSLNLTALLMILAFPITLLFLTQNFLTFFLSLISSFLNTSFCMSLLIIIGEKFSHLFSEQVKRTRKASVLRIVSLISYFIIAFSSGFIISLGFIIVENLISFLEASGASGTIAIIFAIIPFPFAPSSLVALTLVPGQVPINLWILSFIGTAIFALITFAMYRVAMKSLKSISKPEMDQSKQKLKEETEFRYIELQVQSQSPIRAYIKKDLIASFKDYQSLIFILMPIIYPLILAFSLGTLVSEYVSSPIGVMILWMVIMMFNTMIPIMLVGGLLNLEESGSSIMASLPVVPRDQAKAKIFLMLSIQSLSLILLTLVLTVQSQSILVLILLVSSLPIIWSFLLLVFELKILLFSKMKYRYVLEEVNKKSKIGKWIGVIGADIGFFIVLLIIGSIIFISFDIFYAILGLLLIGAVTLPITLYALFKMFPREERLSTFKSGGYLRNKPIIGAIVVLLLFIAFPIMGSFVEMFLFLPWLINLPFLTALIIEFIWIQCFYALFLLYVTPKGLKLPVKTERFKDYLTEVKINKFKPVVKNVVLGISVFIIYGLIVFTGANLLGNFQFFPDLLFGTPNPSLPGFLSLGWFIWIFMLQPGIWEELTFRGVMIPLISRKYSKMTAIISSSILFGIAHSFNIITTLALSIDPLIVLFQVIYTSLLGLLLGYLYVKTSSLIPSIIVHYLIDTVGFFLSLTIIPNIYVQGFYSIVFIGFLPAVFGIILINLISKLWNRRNHEDMI